MKTCRYKPKLKAFIITVIMFFILPLALPAAGVDMARGDLNLSDASVKRGNELFKSVCRNCHSLKYFGYEAAITPESARGAFGKVPPDLSLIAKARGRGNEGVGYISVLLTNYNNTPEKNSVFPNIAMPPPFSGNDPEFARKVKDISAFLDYAAEPSERERKDLGRYVLGYMVVLVALLYALNRKVWRGIRKSALKK